MLPDSKRNIWFPLEISLTLSSNFSSKSRKQKNNEQRLVIAIRGRQAFGFWFNYWINQFQFSCN